MYQEEHDYKGYTIRVSQDLNAYSPREWGFGTIVSIDGANEAEGHVVQDIRDRVNNGQSAERAIKANFPDMVWFHKLYRYSHGGDVWALHDNFPDRRWDVSHAGYVVITRQDIREWYRRERMSDKLRDRIYKDIAQNLKDLTNWSNGFIYGFMVDGIDDPDLDNVYYSWYNDPDEALDNAIAMIDQSEEENVVFG